MKQIDNAHELRHWKVGGIDLDAVALDDGPWFYAPGVAQVLGERDTGNVLRLVDKVDVQKVRVRTKGGIQQASVISEGGLLMLMIRSRSASSEGFKQWAFREYIPGAIRLHKLYQDAKRLGVSFDFSEAQWEWLMIHPYMFDILVLATAGYNSVEISAMLSYNTKMVTAQKRIEKLKSLGFLPKKVVPRAQQLEHRIKVEKVDAQQQLPH